MKRGVLTQESKEQQEAVDFREEGESEGEETAEPVAYSAPDNPWLAHPTFGCHLRSISTEETLAVGPLLMCGPRLAFRLMAQDCYG